MAQEGSVKRANVVAVYCDGAYADIVEAVQEVGDGGLACTGRADEGDLLSRLGVKGDTRQDLLIGQIAEVHVLHNDVTLQAFGGFLGEVFLLLLGKGDGVSPLLALGGRVDDGKHSLRPCQSGKEGRGLLRDHVDGHGKLLGIA